nr:hypothetical protein [Gemmatimonadota bacterium]
MYLSGYTPEHPYTDEFKESGDVVVRYEGWLAGNREPRWTLVLNPAGSDKPTGLAVAGERLFISYVRSARVEVYDTETTVQEGTLQPGPEVDRRSSWHDVPYPIQAFQSAEGEYIVLAEENARGRILMYRHLTPTIGLETDSYTTDNNRVLPLAITNSLDTDAALSELSWQVGEQAGTEAHTMAVPARTREKTTLSLEGVAPWSTFDVDVTASFEDADAVTTNARLTTDYNPLLRDPLGAAGIAGEDIAAAMAGVPAIDLAASGTVMMEGDSYGGSEDLRARKIISD